MGGRVRLMDYRKSLSGRVGNFLQAKGFDLASSTGMALDLQSEIDCLGILHKDPKAKPQKYLFGLVSKPPRRIFLGRIWFRNAARHADEQHWVFEAYGSQHTELVNQLSEEMASSFKVEINLHLVCEEKLEVHLSDYGY